MANWKLPTRLTQTDARSCSGEQRAVHAIRDGSFVAPDLLLLNCIRKTMKKKKKMEKMTLKEAAGLTRSALFAYTLCKRQESLGRRAERAYYPRRARKDKRSALIKRRRVIGDDGRLFFVGDLVSSLLRLRLQAEGSCLLLFCASPNPPRASLLPVFYIHVLTGPARGRTTNVVKHLEALVTLLHWPNKLNSSSWQLTRQISRGEEWKARILSVRG